MRGHSPAPSHGNSSCSQATRNNPTSTPGCATLTLPLVHLPPPTVVQIPHSAASAAHGITPSPALVGISPGTSFNGDYPPLICAPQIEVCLSTYKVFKHKKFQVTIKIDTCMKQRLCLSSDDILIAGLNAKCCRENSNEEVENCKICCVNKKVITVGIQSAFHSTSAINRNTRNPMEIYVFDDCKSNCSSSRTKTSKSTDYRNLHITGFYTLSPRQCHTKICHITFGNKPFTSAFSHFPITTNHVNLSFAQRPATRVYSRPASPPSSSSDDSKGNAASAGSPPSSAGSAEVTTRGKRRPHLTLAAPLDETPPGAADRAGDGGPSPMRSPSRPGGGVSRSPSPAPIPARFGGASSRSPSPSPRLSQQPAEQMYSVGLVPPVVMVGTVRGTQRHKQHRLLKSPSPNLVMARTPRYIAYPQELRDAMLSSPRNSPHHSPRGSPRMLPRNSPQIPSNISLTPRKSHDVSPPKSIRQKRPSHQATVKFPPPHILKSSTHTPSPSTSTHHAENSSESDPPTGIIPPPAQRRKSKHTKSSSGTSTSSTASQKQNETSATTTPQPKAIGALPSLPSTFSLGDSASTSPIPYSSKSPDFDSVHKRSVKGKTKTVSKGTRRTPPQIDTLPSLPSTFSLKGIAETTAPSSISHQHILTYSDTTTTHTSSNESESDHKISTIDTLPSTFSLHRLASPSLSSTSSPRQRRKHRRSRGSKSSTKSSSSYKTHHHKKALKRPQLHGLAEDLAEDPALPEDTAPRPTASIDSPSSTSTTGCSCPCIPNSLTQLLFGEDCCAVARECVAVLQMAWPVCLCYLFQTLLSTVNMAFAGHIEPTEDATTSQQLAAVSLAVSLVNVTGFSFGFGLLSAVDTLASQAYGAGNVKKIGIILQRAVLIVWLYSLPVMALWWFTEEILNLLGQDAETSKLAGRYIRILMPALPFYFLYESIKRAVQTQGIVFPMMLVSLLAMGILALCNYIFVDLLDLGLDGSATSLTIAWSSMPIILTTYLLIRGQHKMMWSGFSKECFKKWPEFFALGIPGAIMSCAEWWGFEIVSFLAGVIGTVELAATSIIMNTLSILLMCPLGLSVVASAQVGAALGANNPSRARMRAILIIILTVFVEIIQVTFLLSVRKVWGKIFTKDAEVYDLVANLLLVCCGFVMFDGLQTASGGLLRGCGSVKIGAFGNVASFYLAGIPAGASVAFLTWLGVFGLWIGIGISVFLTALTFCSVVFATKWEKLAAEVQARELAGVPPPSLPFQIRTFTMATMVKPPGAYTLAGWPTMRGGMVTGVVASRPGTRGHLSESLFENPHKPDDSGATTTATTTTATSQSTMGRVKNVGSQIARSINSAATTLASATYGKRATILDSLPNSVELTAAPAPTTTTTTTTSASTETTTLEPVEIVVLKGATSTGS
ncbi:protein FAM177A1 [Pelomyxa schiedti]|nr:protein FAM177A1 [Pelomyxa schiedti]